MEEWEITTAEGEGVWGNDRYRVSLETRFRIFHDSTHKVNKTVPRYFLSFKSNKCADRRWFDSEERRSLFIDKSFSELAVVDIPESKYERRELSSSLQVVFGESLSSVAFVMDYLELGFSSYRFRIYNWPNITVGDKNLRQGDGGYRDALCDFIAKTIARVDEYLDKGLTIEFTDNSSISVPLKVGKDFLSPEIVEFIGPNNIWLIWQVGQAPFDD